MGISKEKIQTVIENCFNAECNIATIHDAFERGFRAGMQEDVQSVVRCRNCEHWDDMYGICYCEDFEVHCQDYYIGDMHTEPDFFCGFGERKGADNEID